MGVLTWDGPKLIFHQLPPWNFGSLKQSTVFYKHVFTNSIGCRYQLVCFQIRTHGKKKKPLLKICPVCVCVVFFVHLEKKSPHFHPFPQQPRPPSRCIVANKCTASVHIIAAPQDDMARWYATLSGMRSRPGWATKPCPWWAVGVAPKYSWVPMQSHL